MSLQTLSFNEVRDAALKAYKENRLVAQHTQRGGNFPSRSFCLYRHPIIPNCGCAVGVALSDATIQGLMAIQRNAAAFRSLLENGNLDVADSSDSDRIWTLQNAHDAWAIAINNPESSDSDIRDKEDTFLLLLSVPAVERRVLLSTPKPL